MRPYVCDVVATEAAECQRTRDERWLNKPVRYTVDLEIHNFRVLLFHLKLFW